MRVCVCVCGCVRPAQVGAPIEPCADATGGVLVAVVGEPTYLEIMFALWRGTVDYRSLGPWANADSVFDFFWCGAHADYGT